MRIFGDDYLASKIDPVLNQGINYSNRLFTGFTLNYLKQNLMSKMRFFINKNYLIENSLFSVSIHLFLS